MKSSLIRSPDPCQTEFACDGLSAGQSDTDSESSIPSSADLKAEAAIDSNLIGLWRQFEDIAANVQKLQNSAASNDHVELIETMLGRLEPIELAIMATPARTVAGLGVKARHAAYGASEYWNAPLED